MGEPCVRSPIEGKERCATCQRIHDHVNQKRDCVVVADFTSQWSPSAQRGREPSQELIALRNLLFAESQRG